jgi:hypothetical protein
LSLSELFGIVLSALFGILFEYGRVVGWALGGNSQADVGSIPGALGIPVCGSERRG